MKFFDELKKLDTIITGKLKEIHPTYSQKNVIKTTNVETDKPVLQNTLTKKASNFNQWRIIVSFNKSTSGNFDKALHLAKKSLEYKETEYNGQIVYQAMYAADRGSFLDFIKLYDIVAEWKSTAFIINGEITNKKIVGKIKWCYGDKCITGKSSFCYGASYMTKNPFGCHRLQISLGNNPWWSYGVKRSNYVYINKDLIKARIDEYSTAYKQCPCFCYSRIIETLNNLPHRISEDEIASMTHTLMNGR